VVTEASVAPWVLSFTNNWITHPAICPRRPPPTPHLPRFQPAHTSPQHKPTIPIMAHYLPSTNHLSAAGPNAPYHEHTYAASPYGRCVLIPFDNKPAVINREQLESWILHIEIPAWLGSPIPSNSGTTKHDRGCAYPFNVLPGSSTKQAIWKVCLSIDASTTSQYQRTTDSRPDITHFKRRRDAISANVQSRQRPALETFTRANIPTARLARTSLVSLASIYPDGKSTQRPKILVRNQARQTAVSHLDPPTAPQN
jgi:hypothetical protein